MNNPGTINESHYQTEKLIFAAYMIAADKAELVGAYPLKRGKGVIFVLSAPPSSEDLTMFFNGSALVSALRFAEMINSLKSVAYEVLRCNGSLK